MDVNNPNEFLPELAVDVDISEDAKKVDEKGSTPRSSLLSLPGGVEELLLSHVSKRKGGLEGLLNLRLTCSTTKKWVDDLPLHQGRRLFANCNCQAQVDLTEEGSLDKFLEAPPPSHVTSLLLYGVDSHFDPTRELWNRFVEFWSPRLKSLEIKKLSLPLNCRLSELVASTSIRRLSCEEISCGGPADVPDFLLQLEELRLDLSCSGQSLEDPQRTAILRILGSVERLVIPNWSIERAWHLEFATEVLRIREHINSVLTFEFRHLRLSHEDEEDDEELEETMSNFVTAFAALPAVSSIRVIDAGEDFLRQVVLLVGEDALRFFRCVELIDSFSGKVRLTNFPNLKRLECDEGDVRGPIEFPRNLEFLTIGNGLPSEAILSPFLTSLNLRNLECSAVELARSLFVISESCGRLDSLTMSWTCCEKGEKAKKKQVGIPRQGRLFFRNLRSLVFHLDDDGTQVVEFVEAAQLVLSEGLRLPRLSLTSLDVRSGGWDDEPPAPVFDAALLRSLIEGAICKTLCDVYIERSLVAEGAEELLATLEEMEKENSRKRKLDAL